MVNIFFSNAILDRNAGSIFISKPARIIYLNAFCLELLGINESIGIHKYVLNNTGKNQ